MSERRARVTCACATRQAVVGSPDKHEPQRMRESRAKRTIPAYGVGVRRQSGVLRWSVRWGGKCTVGALVVRERWSSAPLGGLVPGQQRVVCSTLGVRRAPSNQRLKRSRDHCGCRALLCGGSTRVPRDQVVDLAGRRIK
jgi:hypothetical protein